jgi:hypothetical protein
MPKGGNKQPAIDASEHIGPLDTGDNIEAKRVAVYDWDESLSEWSRGSNVSYSDILFDPDDSAPVYIGMNKINNTATSEDTWIIRKFTYSGSNVTRIQKVTGVWDDRASLF